VTFESGRQGSGATPAAAYSLAYCNGVTLSASCFCSYGVEVVYGETNHRAEDEESGEQFGNVSASCCTLHFCDCSRVRTGDSLAKVREVDSTHAHGGNVSLNRVQVGH
jgi:hypothetical protein